MGGKGCLSVTGRPLNKMTPRDATLHFPELHVDLDKRGTRLPCETDLVLYEWVLET